MLAIHEQWQEMKQRSWADLLATWNAIPRWRRLWYRLRGQAPSRKRFERAIVKAAA